MTQDAEAITFRLAKSRKKKRPPLLAFILFFQLPLVIALVHAYYTYPLQDFLMVLSSPYALLLLLPTLVLAMFFYGVVFLFSRARNPVWSLALLPEHLTLHRAWGKDILVPFEKIAGLEVGYAGPTLSYDGLKIDIRLLDGTRYTTDRCPVRGEVVEAAAESVRKRLRELGRDAGSRDGDRNLRRKHMRKDLLIANIMVALVTAGFVFLGCYQAYAHYQWSMLERYGLGSHGFVIGEPSPKGEVADFRFAFATPDGRIREGSAVMPQPEAGVLTGGDSVEIRYLESDPDVFHPVGARVGLGSEVFIFVGVWLAIAAVWFVPLLQGKRLAYCRRRFYLLGRDELEEERLPDHRLAEALQ